ncbi:MULTISPECIES: hypothetical protein [unclassified Arthrobacter]|uniref:hypothetical protein n=1 Tax=unclassified Arthrobacter TaxID=235627 RepID=UPI002E0DB7C4|nr:MULTISPECIES: hypothetical protein [unclassified Arthrobacter]
MRTANAARGRGGASALLRRLLAEARHNDYRRLYLKTGGQDFSAPPGGCMNGTASRTTRRSPATCPTPRASHDPSARRGVVCAKTGRGRCLAAG